MFVVAPAQQYGGVRCKDTGCNGRVYELLSDRGSGEPYIRIWLPLESGKSTKKLTKGVLSIITI